MFEKRRAKTIKKTEEDKQVADRRERKKEQTRNEKDNAEECKDDENSKQEHTCSHAAASICSRGVSGPAPMPAAAMDGRGAAVVGAGNTTPTASKNFAAAVVGAATSAVIVGAAAVVSIIVVVGAIRGSSRGNGCVMSMVISLV
jgi:hypothetical protein